jgi:hypothetical protein
MTGAAHGSLANTTRWRPQHLSGTFGFLLLGHSGMTASENVWGCVAPPAHRTGHAKDGSAWHDAYSSVSQLQRVVVRASGRPADDLAKCTPPAYT